MKKWLLCLMLTIAALPGLAVTPPPADKVFPVQLHVVDPNTFSINWQIKPEYFLYSDRIKIELQRDSNVQLGGIRFPSPVVKVDHVGNKYTVYRNHLAVPVAILGKEPGESLLTLKYQGCADNGFCYPPETRMVKLTIDQNLGLANATLEPQEAPLLEKAQSPASHAEALFDDHHWAMIILSFFGLGLLLSFTPCVLPMVPVLSGIIVGHSHAMSTRKAFMLSLSYVLSMALTYAMVGAVVALLGNNLQIAMQSPPIIIIFSLLFVVLSLSMFGFFELKLPLSWQAALGKVSRGQASGHYIGAALMGCLSTLILSPCVTAPLIGVLSYIAHSGNVVMGSLALFFLGLGMGAPLLLIGASAGKWLPKAGQWMNAVKSFFGVMLLAVAIYLFSRVAPAPLIMALWAALLVFSGLFIGAFKPGKSRSGLFSQGTGILLLVYGLLVLVGASMGESNPLQPLARMHYTADVVDADKYTVMTIEDVQTAIDNAAGKPVMLDFYADWCSSCKIMDATTFKDPNVVEALKNFVVLKIDITANTPANKALLNKYGVIAPPTFVFFNSQGEELIKNRIVGETSAKPFLKQLLDISALKEV